MSVRWRVIITPAMDAFDNMAFDEAMVQGYSLGCSGPTLRIYSWQRPSLSLGYSQDPSSELDLGLCATGSVPVVRRMTGGGIILHDKELTYSLACNKEDLGISSRVLSSYRIITSFLKAFYKDLGLDTEYACDSVNARELGERSVLCFAGHEKYDIVIRGRKIGGSAQRRTDKVIFQHGSIPISWGQFNASYFLKVKGLTVNAPEPICLEEAIDKKIDVTELTGTIINSFAKTFGADIFVGELTGREKEIFSDLKEFKYSTDAWNLRRIYRPREYCAG